MLRLGWEFTGNWYPWQVTNATDAANFAAYFRNIVTSMRSVPGQSFKFVWNPNAGNSFGNTYTPEQAYPGSAYVDYVGIDVYDQGWSSPATPQNAWANQLSQSWGLNWLSSFAAEVGRPIVFPEWGVEIRSDGHGMGDDPYFINQFAAWIVQHNVAWTAYFEYDTADGVMQFARWTIRLVARGVPRRLRMISSSSVALHLSKFDALRADSEHAGLHSVNV